MCLILIAVNRHPSYKLILASNRDEYYERPTSRASFWEDAPDLLAGRDEMHGGTWLGITRQGRIGMLTNYRDPASMKQNAPSRGRMVCDYLTGEEGPCGFIQGLKREADQYNGFNLIIGERERLIWYSSRNRDPVELSTGIHALSNHLLNTPWPKVIRGKGAMARLMKGKPGPSPDALFHLLGDTKMAPDEELPRTGVTPEWERVLSPIFVLSPTYGTRASTIILIDREDRVTFWEKTFGPEAREISSARVEFRIK